MLKVLCCEKISVLCRKIEVVAKKLSSFGCS
jgi:hypothetical protein